MDTLDVPNPSDQTVQRDAPYEILYSSRDEHHGYSDSQDRSEKPVCVVECPQGPLMPGNGSLRIMSRHVMHASHAQRTFVRHDAKCNDRQ